LNIHLNPNQIEEFVLGRFSETTTDETLAHVLICTLCQEWVEAERETIDVMKAVLRSTLLQNCWAEHQGIGGSNAGGLRGAQVAQSA